MLYGNPNYFNFLSVFGQMSKHEKTVYPGEIAHFECNCLKCSFKNYIVRDRALYSFNRFPANVSCYH